MQEGVDNVQVGLVGGHHSLWGHVLYPAAIALSRFLELHSDVLLRAETALGRKGKNVLELGAGGGLPGLVAALEGALHVVISDFPDIMLIRNIESNIESNLDSIKSECTATAAGYTWGRPPTSLLSYLPHSEKFDLILLSDLVFNHSQHAALLDSCLALLAPPSSNNFPPSTSSAMPTPDVDLSNPSSLRTPALLCFFSHHRPTKALVEADLGLLSMAKAKGWKVERVWKDSEAGPAFPEDEGDICIRGTVHGWLLTRELLSREKNCTSTVS